MSVHDIGNLILWFIMTGIGVALYLIPFSIAYARKTANRWSVLVVNLFLGWTFIGWVVALAMAASGAKEKPVSARAN